MNPTSEKNIRLAFDLSILAKGIFAALEIAGGVLAWIVPQEYVLRLVALIAQNELSEDPRDRLAALLLHAAQSYSVSSQHFAALYLVSHGAVKLWVIIGLLRKKLWYYPVSVGVFGLFILYQMYRYTFTHSPWLIALSLLDAIVIVLTLHEYRYLRREHTGN